MIARRTFLGLGVGLTFTVIGALAYEMSSRRKKITGERKYLEIDPKGEFYLYIDGKIVKVK